jgi:hypothetical protein|tara:strand:- start:91 stop:453 length:363 start_codon:yes stop_codon:yes gene_type:complete
MSDAINEIKENIDLDSLSQYCGEFAEEMQYSDYNIKVLKISLEDLKNENFDEIIEVDRVKYGDWDTLSLLVPEGEVDEIKKEFEEDLKNYLEDGEVSSFEDIYKSVLYCNNEYVWGGTTY